ncbi:hypothetical protein ACI65C_007351 [Semiaphis heraclei]
MARNRLPPARPPIVTVVRDSTPSSQPFASTTAIARRPTDSFAFRTSNARYHTTTCPPPTERPTKTNFFLQSVSF